MFGVEARVGLATTCLPLELSKNSYSEEDLEKIIANVTRKPLVELMMICRLQVKLT